MPIDDSQATKEKSADRSPTNSKRYRLKALDDIANDAAEMWRAANASTDRMAKELARDRQAAADYAYHSAMESFGFVLESDNAVEATDTTRGSVAPRDNGILAAEVMKASTATETDDPGPKNQATVQPIKGETKIPPNRKRLAKSTTPEKITFIRRKGRTLADPDSITPATLLTTRTSLWTTLANVRTVVRNKKKDGGKASIEELKERFSGTVLAKAADDEDWNKLVASFGGGTTTKNAALVFLEDKTGYTRDSITVLCSKAKTAIGRSNKKMKN